MLESIPPLSSDLLWILCLAFIIAFLLAFSVGANDVSNSFGTSVGSRVLTVTQACILATIFEVAGATLLGYSVCDTFRRNMYDVSLYEDSQKELMLGALSCLMGSAAWNMIATAFKMPISGTHSIVGATIGFSIVLRGWASIKWLAMLKIVASWFISPLLSGFLSSLIYLLISKTIIRKVDPLKYGLKALPLFYGATIFINVASVVISGPNVFGLDTLPWYAGLLIALVAGGGAICGIAMVLVPKLRRKIVDELIGVPKPSDLYPTKQSSPQTKTTSLSLKPLDSDTKQVASFDNVAFKPDHPTEVLTLDAGKLKQLAAGSGIEKPPVAPKPPHLKRPPGHKFEEVDLSSSEQTSAVEKPKRPSKQLEDVEGHLGGAGGGGSGAGGVGGRPGKIRGERYEVFRLFSSLQILTACFASFAHGTNDVSNAVAPLIPIWNIFSTGQENIATQTPIWILAFGGIGICTGLWAWGRAVMGTVGDGLTQLTPSKGFSIELGAAVSVLCATKLGLPISTTHCKVGSVVIVGLVSSHFCSQDNLLDSTEEEKAAESESQAVNWKLFGNIAITWIVTLPLAALASAFVMLVLSGIAL